MSRTITAMFDSRSEAEAAREQLRSQLGADARIIDKSSNSDSSGTGESQGFWADLKDMFVADEDRSTYEECVSRGGFLLCANVPEEQADRACNVLEQGGSVDFNQREQQWRGEGWSGSSARQQGFDADNTSNEHGRVVDEERIPVIEEQLRVGKREIERGGARVRSYVEERPVTEQVNLREEHVNVERRPVDEPVSARALDSNDLLQEREIEMRETSEEAIVGKEARVKEEVVVQKTANERTEQVGDTVRNTRVEVDEADRGSDRGAMFERDAEPSAESREKLNSDTSGDRF